MKRRYLIRGPDLDLLVVANRLASSIHFADNALRFPRSFAIATHCLTSVTTMAQRARIDDIIEGMEMQSDTMSSYLHRPTGRVISASDDALAAAENDDDDLVSEEELAEARAILAAESEYLELPDRFEINEYRMME